MSIFTYLAINHDQKKVRGAINASSEREVRDALRLQGLILLQIKSKKESSKALTMNREELLGFTSQLAQLLEAGLPLYESLVTLEEQAIGRAWHPILVMLREKIHEGATCSQALGCAPHLFDTRFIAMVHAGEASGMLAPALQEIATLLDKRIKLQKQLMTAILYPALLAGFACVVIMILLFFVIPALEPIFEGKELEGLTFVVVGTSQLVRNHWMEMLFVVGSLAGCFAWKRRVLVQKGIFFKLPFVKTLLFKMALARFFRTLASLQRGGVNLMDALKMARETMNFPPLEAIVSAAEIKVTEGSFLSHEFKQSTLIPPLVTRMLAIAEETAQGAAAYFKIAEIYEEDVEKSLLRLGTILQPLILIFMGTIVGIVMLSVLLPLTDIGNLN